jgi:purine-nucleoside phosphorylase
MLIRDHLNLLGINPLRGPNLANFGPRFHDMTQAYDPEFRGKARDIANHLGISIEEGVYAALPGPSYETPAEIQMLRTLGADAVGMSTVPEVIAARHQGMRVLGISIITNQAAGMSDSPISHEEVLENTQKAQNDFTQLLLRWIETYEES